MKRILTTLILILAAVTLLSSNATAQEEVDISGLQVKVVREYFSKFKIQFIEVVIPNDQYSKDNLLKVWKYYCEKYPDKAIRLDLRVFIKDTYEFNRQYEGLPLNMHTWEVTKPDNTTVKLRSFEAQFERKGKGVLAYGGDNELLTYCPDPNKPDEKIFVVLAGKDYAK
jgi:hypothetical protein